MSSFDKLDFDKLLPDVSGAGSSLFAGDKSTSGVAGLVVPSGFMAIPQFDGSGSFTDWALKALNAVARRLGRLGAVAFVDPVSAKSGIAEDLDAQIYILLIEALSGTALSLVQTIPWGQGLAVLIALRAHYDPVSPVRAATLVRQLIDLSYPGSGMDFRIQVQDILDVLDRQGVTLDPILINGILISKLPRSYDPLARAQWANPESTAKFLAQVSDFDKFLSLRQLSDEGTSSVASMAIVPDQRPRRKNRRGKGSKSTSELPSDGKPVCDHCGRPNHTKATCFKLHGRPGKDAGSVHPQSGVTPARAHLVVVMPSPPFSMDEHPVAMSCHAVLAPLDVSPVCVVSDMVIDDPTSSVDHVTLQDIDVSVFFSLFEPEVVALALGPLKLVSELAVAFSAGSLAIDDHVASPMFPLGFPDGVSAPCPCLLPTADCEFIPSGGEGGAIAELHVGGAMSTGRDISPYDDQPLLDCRLFVVFSSPGPPLGSVCAIAGPAVHAYVVSASGSSDISTRVALDSGASRYMSNKTARFQSIQEFSLSGRPQIRVASGTALAAEGMGTMVIHTRGTHPDVQGSIPVTLNFENTLYSSQLDMTLLSMGLMCYLNGDPHQPTNMVVRMGGTAPALVLPSGHVVSIEYDASNLFFLPEGEQVDEGLSRALAVSTVSDEQLMADHYRLGHLNFRAVCRIFGYPLRDPTELRLKCFVCLPVMTTRQPLPPPLRRDTANRPCALSSIDVTGPFPEASLENALYAFVVVDGYSDLPMWYALKSRKGLQNAWAAHVLRVRTFPAAVPVSYQPGDVVASDNEFVTQGMRTVCARDQLVQTSSPPHTPQRNPIAERQIITAISHVRALLYQAKLPTQFWVLALKHVEFLQWFSPSSRPPHKTPLELYRSSPITDEELSMLRKLPFFGCSAFVHQEQRESKLEPKARAGVFVGYNMMNRSYFIYMPDTKQLVSSIHVRFGTNTFLTDPCGIKQPSGLPSGPPPPVDVLIEFTHVPLGVGLPTTIASLTPAVASSGPSTPATAPASSVTPASSPPVSPAAVTPPVVPHGGAMGGAPIAPAIDADEDPLLTMAAVSAWSARQNDSALQTEGFCYVSMIAPPTSDPKTIRAARLSPDAAKWEQALQEQLDVLDRYGAVSSVRCDSIPAGSVVLPSMVVFVRKYDDTTGTVSQFKARVVVQGNREILSDDFNPLQNFSPVTLMQSGKTLISLAVAHGAHIHLADVSAAFLQTDKRKGAPIYIRFPAGLHDLDADGNRLCWVLEKSMYGLKCAPRDWFNKMTSAFVDMGFTPLTNLDACVFVKNLDSTKGIRLAATVDDMLYTGCDLDAVRAFEDQLQKIFVLSRVGPMTQWIGMTFIYDMVKRQATLLQALPIMRMLEYYQLTEVRLYATPMSSTVDLLQDLELLPMLPLPELKRYQSIVGSLIYFANSTRHDIMYATTSCAQFMSNPNAIHMEAVLRIVGYLRNFPDIGITFQLPTDPRMKHRLHGAVDASFGGDRRNLKSRYGFVLFLNEGPIYVKCARQSMIAQSSAHAEYYGAGEIGKAIQFTVNFCAAIHATQILPIIALEDNTSAISIASNPINSALTRHWDLRLHIVREFVSTGLLKLVYCSTADMVADILTKPLSNAQFRKLRAVLMNCALKPKSTVPDATV
jgi:Reverse transcriptase (RNA-dependent DNA polymerase)